MRHLLLILLTIIASALPLRAQKLITYEAGMGSRDPDNADTWILYNKVKAQHEGMTLYADSALLNTTTNEFTAFRHIRIVVSDTTTLLGSRLFYDGNERTAHIWGDTVRLIDGATLLKSDRLTYDRNANTAYYNSWGHTINGPDTLDSHEGLYDTDQKVFVITGEVRLKDSNALLLTDALVYNTQSNIASFSSPTHIYSDTNYLYSELGDYNSDIDFARSFRASFARTGSKSISCDTLFYNKQFQLGQAWGHVLIRDSANDLTCQGRYGETDQEARLSLVTDSALVLFVDQGDSLWLFSDSIFVKNTEQDSLLWVKAYHSVTLFRSDAQAHCDSLFYSYPDSVAHLLGNPTLWYDSIQCTADTIIVHHDTSGARMAFLNGNVMAIERIDSDRFNQVKGKNCIVHFRDGEPTYADILGNAQMVYHLTETPDNEPEQLIGVNVGIGSDMRIYFKNREPDRVATFGNPDMTLYPPMNVPADKHRLPSFNWSPTLRPQHP